MKNKSLGAEYYLNRSNTMFNIVVNTTYSTNFIYY